MGPATTAISRLHLVTDARPDRDLLGLLRAVLAIGTPLVQLRMKDGRTDRDAFALAVQVVALCADHAASCLVDDRVDVALAAGADGVHVGADDLPVAVARRLLGPAAIVGATVRDAASAARAVSDGASYLGVGPMYPTRSKPGLPPPVGPAGIAAVAAAVPGTPVIAIGGVTAGRVPELLAAGAHGVAVIGAVSAAADPARAAAELLAAVGRADG